MPRVLTLHGLFSSNPAGASPLSVCPLSMPVSRLSRSITVLWLTSAAHQRSRGYYFAVMLLACGALVVRCGGTHPVPLIHRTPSSLSAVLHVSDLRHSRSGDSEHLRDLGPWPVPRGWGRGTYSEHDPVGDESFERDTHRGDRGSILVVN
jgi:hypothetical protein